MVNKWCSLSFQCAPNSPSFPLTFGDLMKHLLLVLTMLSLSTMAWTQETFPVNGVHNQRHLVHAFVGAKVYVSPQRSIDQGVLLVKDGKVHAIGEGLSVPEGAVVHDCKGRVIYPSFIDLYAGLNVEKKDKKKKGPTEKNTSGNWNPAIHPEFEFEPVFPFDEKKVDDWLASGIGVVQLHERDGIMRGSSALLRFGLHTPNLAMIEQRASQHFSFHKGSSTNDYPSSHIGAIALFRQTLYDAQWYATTKDKKEFNPSLEALNNSVRTNRPFLFELRHPLSLRNVDMIEEEFGLSFIVKATGKEYLLEPERLRGQRLIVPLAFPKALDVSDPYVARSVALDELKHWEAAPYNTKALLKNGAELVLTRDTLPSAAIFLKHLRKVHETGVSHDSLLAMLTTIPASWLKVEGITGTLRAGDAADFFIANEAFTAADFRVSAHWSNGQLVYEKHYLDLSMAGTYNLVIDSVDFTLKLKEIKKEKWIASAERKTDGVSFKTQVDMERSLLQITLKNDSLDALIRLSGKVSFGGTVWDGTGQRNDGSWFNWAGIKDRKSGKEKEAKNNEQDSTLHAEPSIWYPNMAFGFDTLPVAQEYVITNAVVWTCADTGKLERSDVWVKDGKIKAVGRDMLYPDGLKRIDAKGRHLTPGIIDEHSHIAIRGGVNEWAQASSAEVRISDAVDPWNVQIYRHLAGGVTAAQLLHGSANPIGGQSALIKMKWGETPDAIFIDGADGFIKFALGENVKRSNSRDPKGRFPLTRMGVEQSFVDAFTRAQEYQASKASAPEETKGRRKPTPEPNSTTRTDLELEALVEILEQERFISCHSYVQSEILMLMRVAERFGFRVNTFTHILEGYKVAQEMKEHGVTGSTFSDWWAYKFEVNDAIPYNAALMSKVGVNTAINSDDAEMGRRLNQEAAKAIKYGGVSEEEALKMVTINPAKALHLDDRMGSIEPGKDADLVLWSAHPLSVYSHAEMTFIEGRKFYDIRHQEDLLKRNAEERARIVQKMLEDPSKKKKTAVPDHVDEYHCDTVLEDYWNK